ncbi:hypothetical protein [Fredinandcohnia onubensis]|uniref:hypothetical protein n=1 Tax=Fredinandcohnia onubensis TaxID=1571209 RepID=UPI000C0BB9B5|nr:hypothetical protein [Fredinandcohnia onubensis]
MQNLLCNLENHKWDWTVEAVKKFKEGFIRFNPSEHTKDRVLIGVYGPTQVGKTTFILKLLGIKEEYFSSLSTALRGKRKMGNSATITCTMYNESEDSLYKIIYPNGKEISLDTLADLEEEMQHVRQEIENDETFSLEPLQIHLSRELFYEKGNSDRKRDFSIIDLPGDDSKEKNEIHHVNRILKEYLPRCKVCILMEIASQMTNLTQLKREFVRDWNYLPYHFRVVLTRSVTSSSVQTGIEVGEIASADGFVSYYQEELSRYLETGSKNIRIYPLEFGDSWFDLKRQVPTIFSKANVWIEDIFQELEADLSSVSSPENEIMQLKNLDAYILKKSEQEKSHLEKEIEQIKSEIKETRNVIDSKGSKSTLLEDRIKDIKKELKGLTKLAITKPEKITINRWDDRHRSLRTTRALDNEFLFHLDNLKEEFEKQYQKIMRTFLIIERTHHLKLDPIQFEFTEKSISFTNQYVLETYYKRTNFNYDCYRVESLLHEIILENYQKMLQAFVAAGQKVAVDLNRYLTILEYKLGELADEIRDSQTSLEGLRIKLSDKKNDKHLAEAEWNRDLERSKQLTSYIQASFLEQFAKYQEAFQIASVEEKWLYHQYFNILIKQAERVLEDDF